jgi:hypothetical protein
MPGTRLRIEALLSIALLSLIACDDGAPSSADPPAADFVHDCFVDFALTSEGAIAHLGIEVGYDRAPGDFLGSASDAACTRLDKRLAVFVNDICDEEGTCQSSDRVLLASVLVDHDVSMPVDLFRCRFGGDEIPNMADFDVEVTDASDEYNVQLEPWPVAEITKIECVGDGTTTTTSTLPDSCSGANCPDGEACLDGECVETQSYQVDFAVETGATFGALQFGAAYDCAAGQFDGEGSATNCRSNQELNVHVSFNDHPCDPRSDAGYFGMAMISATGFEGPTVIATCEYTSTSSNAPVAQSFAIEVLDASTPQFAQIPNVRVSVRAIRPIATPVALF